MKKLVFFASIFFISVMYSEVKIEDCASIESDVKRLACYDYLVTGVSKTSEELLESSKNDPKSCPHAPKSRSGVGLGGY